MSDQSFGRKGVPTKVEANSSPSIESFSQRNKKALNRISIGLFGVLGLLIMIIANAEPEQPQIITASFDSGILQQPLEISIGDGCAYMLLSVRKNPNGTLLTVNSQECKTAGNWVTESLYHCATGKKKVTRDGETQSQLIARYKDNGWVRLFRGSSATVIGQNACQIAGEQLIGIVG